MTVADETRRSSSRLSPSALTTASSGRQRALGASGPNAEVALARQDPRRAFGRFLVLSELGRGGMGVVYRAWDETLGRVLALKLLPQDADKGAVERFRREAQAAARLRHPSIVAIHDAGEIGGRPFLAMDFIEGTSLDERLKAEPRLPLARGVEIVRTVARAVHHAHEQGVIHRDLKPQNVMLGSDERPYILDFGIASLKGAGTVLTRTGATLGTPSYMPPEQIGTSGEVDPRADVYSLGATLYQVIAGQPPFVGLSDVNVITAVLTKEPVPPSVFNRRAQGDLDTIVLRCLEKQPSRRYASAEDLAAELDRWLAGEPILAKPLGPLGRAARKLRRNAVPAAAVGAAVLLAATAMGWSVLGPRLREWSRARAAERASAAVLAEATRIARSATEKVDRESEALEAGGARVAAAIASRALAAVAPLEDETALLASLRSTGTKEGGEGAEPTDIDRAVAEAARAVPRGAICARAARLAARAHEALEDRANATRERVQAYRQDPAGDEGALAFLEIVEGLAQRNEHKRALELLETLSARPLRKDIRARADAAMGRALLGLGRIAHARGRLARALASGALPQVAADSARFALSVATRFALPRSEGSKVDGWIGPFVRTRPGEGPPDHFITNPPGCVCAYRVDATSGRCEEVSRIPFDSHYTASPILSLATANGLRFASLGIAPGRKGLEIVFFKLEGETLVRAEAIPLPRRLPLTRLIVAGDFDGDGRDDIVFSDELPESPGQRPTVKVILDPLGRAEWKDVPAPPGCDGHDGVIADLGGTGRRSLVLASERWSGYSLRSFELDSGRFVESYGRVVGQPSGIARVPRKDGDYVLAGADRDQYTDAVFEASEDLGSDAPDAIWKLARDPKIGARKAEKLLTRPFKDRVSGWIRLRGAGILPEAPDVFVAEQCGPELPDTERALVVVDPATRRQVLVGPRPGEGNELVFLPDLDGDGVPELGFRVEGRFFVRGLTGLGRVPDPPEVVDRAPAPATPLDVGLDLVACGEPEAAAAQLRSVLARGDLSLGDRARGLAALSRALERLDRHEEARKVLLDLVLADPRSRKEGLLLASTQAEERGNLAEARADLERLQASEALADGDAREVERRLDRIRPLTSLTEKLAIDMANAGSLDWVVEHPLQAIRGPRGVSLRAPHGYTGSILSLPFDYDGSAVRLTARLRVERAEFGQPLFARLATEGTEIGFTVDYHGGGSPSTCLHEIGFQNLERFDPRETVTVETTMNPRDFRTTRVVTRADGRRLVRPDGIHAPLAGLATLMLGANPGSPGHHGAFEIESITIEAAPGALKLRKTPEKDQGNADERALALAFRTLVFGDPGDAAAKLVALADGAQDPRVRKRAAPIAAVAVAEAGRESEATDRFLGLLSSSPGDLDEVFANAASLRERSRRALAQAYRRHHAPTDPTGLAGRVNEIPPTRQGERAIALLALRDAVPLDRSFKIALAQLWEGAGDIDFALATFAELGDDPDARAQAGFLAARYDRLELALDLWRGLDLDPGYAPYKRRAERVVGKGAR